MHDVWKFVWLVCVLTDLQAHGEHQVVSEVVARILVSVST